MTPDPKPRPDTASGADVDVLDAAAQELRDHVDDRWVEIADSVLAHALRATRQSFPVHAEADSGPIAVSTGVLQSYLRAATGGIPGVAVTGIYIHLAGRDTYAGVSISVVAQFGVPLLPLADEIRERVLPVLHDLLGPVVPPVTVTTTHVHVADVTPHDPHLR